MTTPMQRYVQAHQHAMNAADKAYHSTHTSQTCKWRAFKSTYNREMAAFFQLEAMRWPHPNQTEIDRQSAELLTR